jgi:pyruvate formate-lyase/glycerol dehydratase family glycyl radical enzyme
MKKWAIRQLVPALLRLMAFQFNHRASLRKFLKSDQGWINFTIGFRTEDRAFQGGLSFLDGKVTAESFMLESPDTTMVFANEAVMLEMLSHTPSEVLDMLMLNKIMVEGNFTYLNLFNFYLSALLGGIHQRMDMKRRQRQKLQRKKVAKTENGSGEKARTTTPERLHAPAIDPGVRYLKNPYLSDLSLTDFPRLQGFLSGHFSKRPEICPERSRLLTRWYKKNGFETDGQGNPWSPELRQGHVFKYLMENKEPIIRKNDLLAGTTTSKPVGVIIYPDAHGTMIWGELLSVPNRELNPYDISAETVEVLHKEVFPFWINRNFREWVRLRYDNPLCQKLDERFAVYFVWKTVGISHTIPDFPSLLALGTFGIIEKTHQAIIEADGDATLVNPLRAMVLAAEGLNAYADNLSKQATKDAQKEVDPERRDQLKRLAEICKRVPKNPPRTLDEAVNAIWITWVGMHNENTNTGLSLGRLDTWLQPYFEQDMAACKTVKARDACIRKAVELVGCLFMACCDHMPLIPDIGNYLFGGSSSDQAITLGGVHADGTDAVCDMTYIFLKVTEMLGIRDPNVNARYQPGVSSDAYLQRLCEVNKITGATPSLHNDEAVLASIAQHGYPLGEARDWSAVGCVEPTISGKQFGHTGSILMNIVAAMEMALGNGAHPLMNWKVGPETGDEFDSFEEFIKAFEGQFSFLIDQAVAYNFMLANAHVALRPTPLLSAMMDGCVEKAKDVVNGGARYNSSGVALIGLADVTDSLMAIKTLVFDQKKTTLREFQDAIQGNFQSHPKLLSLVKNKAPKFGSGNPEAKEMAERVARFAHERFNAHRNYRGGPYVTGFWSMSNHVAFGTLAGALPSGRLRGKAFTPGLTPQPGASVNLLDNLRDVAGLDPKNMDNNMAFNVKVVPGGADSHQQVVDRMAAYVKAYFSMGGMQMQMNMVSSETLRQAMAAPDSYKQLLVRISGYNAYFTTLNRDMQIELIERSEYGI